MSDVIIRLWILPNFLIRRWHVAVVVHGSKDNMWKGCRCVQDGLSLFQNLVIVNVETLTVHISLA